jgi:hypothetical protein
MVYIENMFSDAGIDADVKEETEIGSFVITFITFSYGDKINGFKYHRKLCRYDCEFFPSMVIKIIENDIKIIKSTIRDYKLKELGI